jgi:hypothetical protein
VVAVVKVAEVARSASTIKVVAEAIQEDSRKVIDSKIAATEAPTELSGLAVIVTHLIRCRNLVGQ